MDVLHHVMQEPGKVESLLARIAASESGAERAALVDDVSSSFTARMTAEEPVIPEMVAARDMAELETEATSADGAAQDGVYVQANRANTPGPSATTKDRMADRVRHG